MAHLGAGPEEEWAGGHRGLKSLGDTTPPKLEAPTAGGERAGQSSEPRSPATSSEDMLAEDRPRLRPAGPNRGMAGPPGVLPSPLRSHPLGTLHATLRTTNWARHPSPSPLDGLVEKCCAGQPHTGRGAVTAADF